MASLASHVGYDYITMDACDLDLNLFTEGSGPPSRQSYGFFVTPIPLSMTTSSPRLYRLKHFSINPVNSFLNIFIQAWLLSQLRQS